MKDEEWTYNLGAAISGREEQVCDAQQHQENPARIEEGFAEDLRREVESRDLVRLLRARRGSSARFGY